jgi:hypothetical protein
MNKQKILISIRDGNIENIITTTDNVQFVIIDHDNLEVNCTETIQEIDNLYQPDLILSNTELDEHIQTIKKKYEKDIPNDGALLIPVKEIPKQGEEEQPEQQCDVYIKNEGDFAGIIMLTPQAKKTAVSTGFENDYLFTPDQFRFDVFKEQVEVIIDWCHKQNLTYEES